MSDVVPLTLNQYFEDVIEIAMTREPLSAVELHVKGSEEYGELAEQILYAAGKLRHKTMDEPIEHEFGDVLNCLVTATVKSMITTTPNLTPEEAKQRLIAGMMTKLCKYRNILGESEI